MNEIILRNMDRQKYDYRTMSLFVYFCAILFLTGVGWECYPIQCLRMELIRILILF